MQMQIFIFVFSPPPTLSSIPLYSPRTLNLARSQIPIMYLINLYPLWFLLMTFFWKAYNFK